MTAVLYSTGVNKFEPAFSTTFSPLGWYSVRVHKHLLSNCRFCKNHRRKKKPSLLIGVKEINPLKTELNPICYLLALLGAHHFLHISRIRVKILTFRRLMSYISAGERPAAARLLRSWIRIPRSQQVSGYLSVVSVVCCQVEVSATSWSLVQRSPTDCAA